MEEGKKGLPTYFLDSHLLYVIGSIKSDGL
jgi:hypothetical protein